MEAKECCCYVHTYSALEGLQRARTDHYCGYASDGGVVLELQQAEPGGALRADRLFLRAGFPEAMRLLQYLCENSIGLEQWREVLQDLEQCCETVKVTQLPCNFPDFSGIKGPVCGKC